MMSFVAFDITANGLRDQSLSLSILIIMWKENREIDLSWNLFA